jgi:putative two-component system response regulator
MIVDDDIVNLKVGKSALADVYDVFTVPSAAKMFELLERNKPEIIMLDINMPEMNGYEALKILREKPETQDIPVIFLTARSDVDSEIQGLSLGAVDYISKPFLPPLLRKRVELHLTMAAQKRVLEEQGIALLDFNDNLYKMVEEKTCKVLELQNAILKTVADLVESRDHITGGHIERTQRGVAVMLEVMEDLKLHREITQDWDSEILVRSSQLHDVGKISISDTILNKPGKLTPDEFEKIKQHTTVGVEIIRRIEENTSGNDFLKYAEIMAGTHHEKWDGSGYPNGLSGEAIPLPGRIMAIADVYDALVSERPYKKAFPKDEAARIIAEGSGTFFDPTLVDVFMRVADRF